MARYGVLQASWTTLGDTGRVSASRPTASTPGLARDWSRAFVGAVYALPAAVVMLAKVSSGVALSFGVLPATIVGLAPTRRARARVVALGALVAVSIFAGSLLSNEPVLAVVGIALLVVGAAQLSTIRPAGQRRDDRRVADGRRRPELHRRRRRSGACRAHRARLALRVPRVVVLARVFGPGRAAESLPSRRAMLGYGIRLGAAGATAAAIGFGFGFDHVGWACAAVLLVMRPSAEMQELRSAGRVLSVVLGALVAAGLARFTTAPGWYCVAAIAVIAGAAATRPSRWYVTPAFTTFIALSKLLLLQPESRAGALQRASRRDPAGCRSRFRLRPRLAQADGPTGREHGLSAYGDLQSGGRSSSLGRPSNEPSCAASQWSRATTF